MNDTKTISDFLMENKKKGSISFHMPGHKGRSGLFRRAGYGDFMEDMIGNDITEIPGADALFCPATSIKAVMDNYAELYGAVHTELLVNGSSSGVMAAILASVPQGGKLILGRNSHHSAFSALRLGNITPVYARPEIDPDYNLQTWMSPDEIGYLAAVNPDASAILITSPNYYGMLSDIEAIAEIAHDNNMILIVDQAHGAHLVLWDRESREAEAEGGPAAGPCHAAENLGADIVINSTHKTLLSYTGSGILNICSHRVDRELVSEYLRMLQTTSPSYIAMGSLDVNEKITEKWGTDFVRAWKADLAWFLDRACRINGVTIAGDGYIPESGFALEREKACLDPTKINITMADMGLSGDQLERELRYRGIMVEMVHGEYVMLMTGAGNIRSDYEKLLAALHDISQSYGIGGYRHCEPASIRNWNLRMETIPQAKEMVPLYAADGRVLYNPIIIYPPGSPVACPGEVMNMDVISYIAEAVEQGNKVSGVDEEGWIAVGARQK